MTDPVVTPPVQMPTWEWRTAIGLIVLLFNGGIIVWCIGWGNPANLLHQNALSWSYISGLAVLAGLGFGTVIEYLNIFKKA